MKLRAVLAALAIVLVPATAQSQEANQGYDKTEPIVLTVDQEYAGTTDSDQERKYFMAHVEADAEYRLDMTGLSVDLDIYYLGSDDTFLRDSVGRSTNAEDNDERIQFTPKEDAAYFMLHNYDYKESDFRLLLTRSRTYVDEVASLSPVRLDGEVSYQGQVGSRSSLYELGGLTAGSTYRIAIDGLQVNADLLVFSDPLYRDELARSNKRYTEGDFVTVSTGSDVLYVEVRGAAPLGNAVHADRRRARSTTGSRIRGGAHGDPGRRGGRVRGGAGQKLLLLRVDARAAPIRSSCCRRRWMPISTCTAMPVSPTSRRCPTTCGERTRSCP